MSVYICKNRKTEAIIRRTDDGIFPEKEFRYYLYCMTHEVHGPGRNQLGQITRLQRRPWQWCPRCANIHKLKSEKSE